MKKQLLMMGMLIFSTSVLGERVMYSSPVTESNQSVPSCGNNNTCAMKVIETSLNQGSSIADALEQVLRRCNCKATITKNVTEAA